MDTDPEVARSDLYLSGAVYLFGPLLLRLLNPLREVPGLGQVLAVVAPLLTTALVPLLLARYRKESLSTYGLAVDRGPGLRRGLVVGVPLVVAVAVVALLERRLPPNIVLTTAVGESSAIGPLVNAANWIGLMVLALYATVKGRDAFRSDLQSVRTGVIEIGRIVAGVALVAALLLVVPAGPEPGLFLPPLGIAAGGLLLLRELGAGTRSTTTRATLLAPVVLLALRPFNLLGLFVDAGGFVVGLWEAALLGGLGLLVAATLEARRTGWAAVALAVLLAVAVPFPLTLLFA